MFSVNGMNVCRVVALAGFVFISLTVCHQQTKGFRLQKCCWHQDMTAIVDVMCPLFLFLSFILLCADTS